MPASLTESCNRCIQILRVIFTLHYVRLHPQFTREIYFFTIYLLLLPYLSSVIFYQLKLIRSTSEVKVLRKNYSIFLSI